MLRSKSQVSSFWLALAAAIAIVILGASAGSADQITITKVEYKADKSELKIEAKSSDQPDAVLTLVGFGQMKWKKDKYEYKAKPVDCPGSVTVTSTFGGSTTAVVCAPSGGEGVGVYSSGHFELGDGNAPPGFPAEADILPDAEQMGPDWGDIFDADGLPRQDVIAYYGGQWALFFADDISLGSGFESTALAKPGGRVRNGVADADHDIGNAYVYTTFDTAGNLIVYAGAERLGGGDSYLEFEFNQEKFRLGHGGYGQGVPWEIVGERLVGDVVVRVWFTNGAVSAMAVDYWAEEGWQPLADVTGEGCDLNEFACVIANGDIIDGGPWLNFDTSDNPEEIAINRFAEFGLNVGGLLGIQHEFVTVQIRTPQDIAFGYFGEGS